MDNDKDNKDYDNKDYDDKDYDDYEPLFNHGGFRKGSGRKKGTEIKPKGMKRKQLNVSVPEITSDQLKIDHKNVSKYIKKLILEDYKKRGKKIVGL